MKKLISLLSILFLVSVCGQQTPASKQIRSILFINTTVHTGEGTVLYKSAVGFENGKITYVGNSENPPAFDQVIDATDKHIYPGFIATNSTLGLVEVDAVRATSDVYELGDFLPHVRTAIAYDAESKIVESMRPNGVLVAQVAPRGGRISGSSSVMQMDAWNWEDAIIKEDEGIHLNWPRPYSRGRYWLGEDPSLKVNKNYLYNIQKLKTFIENAKVYDSKQNPVHLPYQAMKGLFDGSKTIYLHATDEKQIVDGISYLKKIGLNSIVLVGGNDSPKHIKFLKENNIAVIVSRPHRLPDSEDEDPKQSFKLASQLIDAGILVSIDVSGRMERMYTRNLPFYAGSFAAYGIDKEVALQLISLNPAKILGVEDRLGSITEGKDATLFICEGDALDMRTNIIHHAFIGGREISLETHQTELWKRYSNKYKSK
ncbi:MAG: amidohydrolase family protein [Flavobacteriaceae bacterium]|nr:amidohydrolase family protein [Flavobacteriaceae bacterium]